MPEKLPELVKDPAFAGKDDCEHSRLKQYKILEEKTAAKAQSGSNEEFLNQSEIHVELIEDCSDKLDRIHEMIHRNNQLNFTKDRISQEEVDRIFTAPDITSGVVHVTDKYGDRGIVGCYAIKDGKTLQFVFSCRILGMGVEQWVYAELGYPDIEVVGEVAAELNKTDRPKWVNSLLQVREDGTVADKAAPSLIVYGTCPLRPIWAYLQPKLPNAKFAEIDPQPCPLNLAVTLRESEDQKSEWLSTIPAINNIYTFDKEVYSSETNYVLITFIGLFDTKKYERKDNGSYFFSVTLNKDNADNSVLDNYRCLQLSREDIIKEISYICEHLSKNTKLLILTAPELEFPSKGKDEDYFRRQELNKIAYELSEKYKCIHLININKFATSPADFFEPIPEHYNRSVGYYLADEILNYMGIINTSYKETAAKPVSKKYPDNAVIQNFNITGSNENCKIIIYILNGRFFVDVQLDRPEKYLIQCTIIRGRWNEFVSEKGKQYKFDISVERIGIYRVRINVFDLLGQNCICNLWTVPIDYSKFNYIKYFDPKDSSYDAAMININEFINNNILADSRYNLMVNYITELASDGINFFDYFSYIGIYEINLVVDQRIGKLLMPFIKSAKVKIKNIFTADNLYVLRSMTDLYSVNAITGALPLCDKDVLLIATDFYDSDSFRSALLNTHAKIFSMMHILAIQLTKYIFVNRIKDIIPKTIMVRTANLHRYADFDYSKLTANEKQLDNKYFINVLETANYIKNNFDSLPPQLKAMSEEKLSETMNMPASVFDSKSGIYKYADRKGKYVNVEEGMRYTPENPDSYIGTIYIFGGPHAFGYGVGDGETVAAFLQKIIALPYRVVNFANCWNYDYDLALNLMSRTVFQPNDIAIFIMANWGNDYIRKEYLHWLHWDTIEQPIIKVDAFPLFEKRDRPDYFLHRYGYTPECNLELAKLIRDAVYKNIKLFDIK